jgi:uncharacterized membrane protein
MNKIWKILLKGIAAVLPIGLTLYFIYWLIVSIEKVVRPLIGLVLPEQYYWPGMGLIVGILVLFFIGLMVNAWLFKCILGLGEDLLEKIPLIKTIYGGLSDFMAYFSPSDDQEEIKKVVMVTLNDMQLIGFITGEIGNLPGIENKQDKVAVYLPMSYQLGGFTVYLSKDKVETIDISVEDAMRRVLTAGLSKQHK